MARKRDRHGRGLRGPLAMDNRLTGHPAPLRLTPSRVDYFLDCLDDSIARIEATCPEAVRGVDIGIEPVPSDAAMWQGMVDHNAIPLAGAIDAANNAPARVVLYERPIERRALDRDDLAALVHRTLVEQLASLTGRSALDIDPRFEDDW
ncbi:MAG: metallopeptidase family protein [Propionibacteriaceae bacterium]|nr:metallopeptidase family protein [Propionibacteriaceae bacterium]